MHTRQIGRPIEKVIPRVRQLAEECAVIEAGGELFGGGNLVSYFGIRSNTSASGFLKVIEYPKGTRREGYDKVMPQFQQLSCGELA